MEIVPAPLPVDLAEKALRHARRLDHAEALQDGWLVRHELPQEVLALRYVALTHSAAKARHVSQHLFVFILNFTLSEALNTRKGHLEGMLSSFCSSRGALSS